MGIVAGMLLRPAHLSRDAIEVLGFPGEVMLRLLKMLVLPLVAGSMVAGDTPKKAALALSPIETNLAQCRPVLKA